MINSSANIYYCIIVYLFRLNVPKETVLWGFWFWFVCLLEVCCFVVFFFKLVSWKFFLKEEAIKMEKKNKEQTLNLLIPYII